MDYYSWLLDFPCPGYAIYTYVLGSSCDKLLPRVIYFLPNPSLYLYKLQLWNFERERERKKKERLLLGQTNRFKDLIPELSRSGSLLSTGQKRLDLTGLYYNGPRTPLWGSKPVQNWESTCANYEIVYVRKLFFSWMPTSAESLHCGRGCPGIVSLSGMTLSVALAGASIAHVIATSGVRAFRENRHSQVNLIQVLKSCWCSQPDSLNPIQHATHSLLYVLVRT